MTAATFQTSVSTSQGFGVVGDLYSDQPKRAESWILALASAVGRMQSVSSQGVCTPGGAAGSVLAGVVFNPKVYALSGDGTNPLNPSLALAQYAQVECLKEGELVIPLAADAAIGDAVSYHTTTGVLSTYKQTVSFTASQATTVLTVSAVASGVLGVGTVVKNAAGEILGTIISLGTGVGADGTYNMNTSATVGSAAMTGNGVPAADHANAYGEITRFTPNKGSAQLAVASFNMPY